MSPIFDFNSLNFLESLGLFSAGLTVVTIGILGFIVFFNDRKSATNRAFLFFALLTICWSVFNYLSHQFILPEVVLLFLRTAIFFAVWHALSFFYFCYVFPKKSISPPRWYKFFLIPLACLVSVVTLTPLVFTQISLISAEHVVEVVNGPAIPLFGVTVVSFVLGGLVLLFRKTRISTGIERVQLKIVLIGTLTTFFLILVFNFLLPVVFNITQFVLLGALYLFPFIGFTFYAIARHQFLSVKVIATEILTFAIWVVVLFELLKAETIGKRVFEFGIFILVLFFGILLIRSVRKEITQRERLELLTKELQTANVKLKELDDLKTDFISIASHQLRTPLTAIKGYSSMILEGSYGESSLKIRGVIEKIFQSSQRLIYIVNDLLDISRIEQGRFSLAPEDVKVANVVRDVVEELKPAAAKKGVTLDFMVSVENAEVKVKADFNKIRQVFVNLIDNSIKYTPQGFVHVAFERQGGNVLMSVKDSGIGISQETMRNLFQKFSRAKGVSKLHTDGSGLGLYVAKEIVAAHGGRVWAESEGEGKGSQFYVLLPIEGNENTTAADGRELEKFVEGM